MTDLHWVLRLAIDEHPNEVFLYSVKHNYPDLVDRTAKLTLRNSVWDFLSLIQQAGLHDDVSFRWVGLPSSRTHTSMSGGLLVDCHCSSVIASVGWEYLSSWF